MRSLKPLLLTLLATVAIVAAGCGSSSESLIHVRGSSATTTKATLDHWMRSWAGQDFRASVGTKGPEGLASEPANYPECVNAAKKVVPRDFSGKLKLSNAEISSKCHQLYRAIKSQALSFLISQQWTVAEAAEANVKISDALLQKEFVRFRQSRYPTEIDLNRYLAERHMALSDVLYQLKANIIVTRLLPRFQAEVKKAGGGEKAYVRLALAHYHEMIARTTCKRGYIAPDCSEYHATASDEVPPNTILEEFVQAHA
jgi:hypothetical protein